MNLTNPAFVALLNRRPNNTGSEECDLPSNALLLTGLDVNWERPFTTNYEIRARLFATSASAAPNVFIHATASWASESDYNFSVLNNTTATGGLGINGATGRLDNEQVFEASDLTAIDSGTGNTGLSVSALSYAARQIAAPTAPHTAHATYECDTGPLYLKLTPFIQCGSGLIAGTSQQTTVNFTPFCPPCPRPSFTVNSFVAYWQSASSGYDLYVSAQITENNTITGYWTTFAFDEAWSGGNNDWAAAWEGRWTYGHTTTPSPNPQGWNTWGKLLTLAELQAGYNISDQVSALKNYSECNPLFKPDWRVYIWPVVDCATDSVRYWPADPVYTNIPEMYKQVDQDPNLCWTPPTPHHGRWVVEDCSGNQLKVQFPSGTNVGLNIPVRYNDPAGSGTQLCRTTVTEDWTGSADLTLSSGNYWLGGAVCCPPPTSYYFFTLTNCSTSASINATDPSGYAPSVGDVVEVTPSGGSAVCATVVSSGTSATDPQTTITGTFTDCGECNATNFCMTPSDFSMTLSGGSYAGGTGYHNTVQITQAGTANAVNIETQLTLETKLGGRAASDVTLSSFGQVTGLSISSGSIVFAYDGSSCYTAASENLAYRLKVECGDNSTGSWVTHSTSYSSWSSLSVNHASAGQQCSSGGSNFEVTDCNDSSTTIIDDSGGYGIQVGDFVDWYDNSGNGPFCGEVTASSSGTATGSAYGGTYMDCADCTSSNGLTLYEVTDCNSSTTYIVSDPSSYTPYTGDIVYFLHTNGTDVCAEVTNEGVAGTSVGEIQNTYTTCSDCNTDYGLGGGGGGGGGGGYIRTTTCDGTMTHLLDDVAGINPSVGDVISYYDSLYTTVYCGTVTAINESGTPMYETSYGPYNDCDDCNSNEGL